MARIAVRVTLLAGGVGGARFARGLVAAVDPASVTIIGNVGDDVELLGLHVSPDLDTVLYTLSGRIDPVNGWGVAGDTREAQTVASELGGAGWFILGDRDIGLHLVRSERLRAGEPLSSITADLARRLGTRGSASCRPPTIPCAPSSGPTRASSTSSSGSSATARSISCARCASTDCRRHRLPACSTPSTTPT